MRASTALACITGALFGMAYASGWWQIPTGWVWGPAAFWLAACCMDMAYAVRYRHFLSRYEQSPVLRVLAGRLRLEYAVPAALAAEFALVVLSPFLVTHEWDSGFLSVAAVLIGMVHMAGLAESMSFVRRRGAGPAAGA